MAGIELCVGLGRQEVGGRLCAGQIGNGPCQAIAIVVAGNLLAANKGHRARSRIAAHLIGQLDILNRAGCTIAPGVGLQFVGNLELRQLQRTGAVVFHNFAFDDNLGACFERNGLTVRAVDGVAGLDIHWFVGRLAGLHRWQAIQQYGLEIIIILRVERAQRHMSQLLLYSRALYQAKHRGRFLRKADHNRVAAVGQAPLRRAGRAVLGGIDNQPFHILAPGFSLGALEKGQRNHIFGKMLLHGVVGGDAIFTGECVVG